MKRTIALAAAFGLAGVQAASAALPPPVPAGAAGIPVFSARLVADGERNRVLNQMEIGVRAFWAGDNATAKAALDDAILRISSVFAGSEDSAKARKLWYDEGSKTFKGEPYERAMAFLYRGLLYMQDGDYENARAAFRQGLMQDAFAEEDQNRTDFAVLLYLDAFASHLNGDPGLRDDVLVELKKLRPDFQGFGEKDDILIFVESGTAPRKLGDGLNHSYFVFRRGKGFTERRATLNMADQAVPLTPMEDIFFQATTRGGREIDQILQGKATFKNTTNAVGSVFADTAIALSENTAAGGYSGYGDAVGVLAGIGVLSLVVSNTAKPEADTRTWTSLPDTIHVMTFASGGTAPPATVSFLAKDGSPVAGIDQPITYRTTPQGHFLGFARSR